MLAVTVGASGVMAKATASIQDFLSNIDGIYLFHEFELPSEIPYRLFWLMLAHLLDTSHDSPRSNPHLLLSFSVLEKNN